MYPKSKFIKVLVFLFFVISAFHILYASIIQRGLAIDGSFLFGTILNKLGSQDNSVYFTSFMRARAFISYLQQIPLNLVHLITNTNSKSVLSFLYSLPFFLYPLLVIIWNYFLSKRTKRTDIFIIQLGIYCIFILPCEIWANVEAMLAIPLFFTLFHYLCADIEYKKHDIFLIAFLLIVSCCSSEAIMYSGPLLFLSALFYATKTSDKTQKTIKLIIGISGILMPFAYLLWYQTHTDLNYLANEGNRFFNEITLSKKIPFKQNPYLMMGISFFIIIDTMLKKRAFNLFDKCILTSLSILAIFLTFSENYFSGYMPREGIRVWLFIILPIAITFITVKDIIIHKNIEFNPIEMNNLLCVLLLIGIVNSFVQINNSIIYDKCLKSILKEVSEQSETITYIKNIKHPQMKIFKTIFVADMSPIVNICATKQLKIDKLLCKIPENPTERIHTKENTLVTSYQSRFDKKNKFWDLETIYKEIEKNQK